ncbi:hypothetical protein LMB49_10640 [Limosilactobacillus reuteri]|uniref:hypothetical protein n=1 Tax=Limosilactobacillus reuteri TaxID=1598 RepID=UPI001E59EEB2|nr:hypothetical protein [Limosilactobacillus reuteri]MCC4370582.1 hypothetical protein [Limosilactobacillus reuteri]MCC4371849.1 hypothetical protein [Limosilactobacillus reuteri]MCC4509321.1 hypothetical protein [Limosilactobacillus reuteri]MCC4509364.1 hypothetical protein [Limosilactobacillus reuteri]
MYKNIVEEIIELVNGKTEDIDWIGSSDGKKVMSWNEFNKKFNSLTYDNGFGGTEIAEDLVVIMKDGRWANRGGFDGAEWFVEHWAQDENTPIKQHDAVSFDQIVGKMK